MTTPFSNPQSVKSEHGRTKTPGILLHSPKLYDLSLRIFFLGREHSFRERLLSFVALRSGESVLDVGCGTGSLAILAKRQVGPSGSVVGIDASREMIARARRKAEREGLKVDFLEAQAQASPFPAAQFDVVLSTLVLHHLPRPARAQLASEASRVLRPGGRLLVVDFWKSSAEKPLWRGPHQRHGKIDPGEMAETLTKAGLDVVAKGPVGVKDLTFALAKVADRAQSQPDSL